MAETMTLKQFSENLQTLVNTDENVAALTMPIDFQDVSADTLQIVNEYETYLTNNDYENAYNLRKNNPVLETLILDATKLNYLQTLMLTSYEFAKGEKSAANMSYDATESQLKDENGELVTNVQDAIDVLDTSVNSTVQTELDKINETLDNTVEKLETDIQQSLNTVDQTLGIRFNETGEVVQIYKDGTWEDWLTYNHDGIIVVSEAKVILNKSDVSIGSEITGGWTPSGAFSAQAETSAGETDTKTTTAETNNMISMNSIKHIDVSYRFVSRSSQTSWTNNSSITLYLVNEVGEQIASAKAINSNKGNGSFTLSLNTNDIIGMCKIGYKLYSYGKNTEYSGTNSDGDYYYTQTNKTYVYIDKVALYTM